MYRKMGKQSGPHLEGCRQPGRQLLGSPPGCILPLLDEDQPLVDAPGEAEKVRPAQALVVAAPVVWVVGHVVPS